MRTVRRGLLPGVRIERVRLDESVDRRLRRLGLYLVIPDRGRGRMCWHVAANNSPQLLPENHRTLSFAPAVGDYQIEAQAAKSPIH